MDTPFCRGCLAEYGDFHNMVEHGLLEEFYKFSEVKDNAQDKKSVLLCNTCAGRLKDCIEFRSMCQKAYSLKSTESMNSFNVDTRHGGEDIKEGSKQINSVSNLLYDKKLVVSITAPDVSAKIPLPCPYACFETFTKKPDLLTHMMRKHDASSDFEIDLQYCCPINQCVYSQDGSKRFARRKFLNQHLNKVHSGQAQTCSDCLLNFSTTAAYTKHLTTCNVKYQCSVCGKEFKTNERFLVHLMRKHPVLHQKYKMERKALRRDTRRVKCYTDPEYLPDSPKRSSATQTLSIEGIRNDVTLPSWPETKTDEISTQTAFDLLKSHGSDEDSIYLSEAVPLADIQTQTFPLEFGLTRSNKETITSETQSPDLSIKETQTCCCLYESPKFAARLFDSVSSSPAFSQTSAETQTADLGANFDALLGFTSAETQTSFEEFLDKDPL